MKIECPVCMHHCRLEEGQLGRCHARKNIEGISISTNYGKATSIALDPIEKKPLYHFFPGSKILSYGSFGCNLKCPFCQNHTISQASEDTIDYIYISPGELTQRALELVDQGNIGVAFTYNEPLLAFEYLRDTAKLLKQHDLKVVVVTNGAVTEGTAKEILPYIDAMNIDLKGFTEGFYKWLGGDLETVKTFIRLAVLECHVELTTLIVPGHNDTPEEMRKLSQWVASIDKNIPLHISRYFPAWKTLDTPATEVEKVYALAEVAREVLTCVHEGNC